MTSKKIRILSIGVVLIAFTVWMYMTNTIIKVNKLSIGFLNLPKEFDGFRIVQISDLHNAEFGIGNEKLIERVKNAKPDVIVITGDIIDSNNTDVGIAIACAKSFSQVAPCYYVTGNHEAWISDEEYSKLEEGLLESGVHILHNDAAVITKGDASISIIGIDDEDVLKNSGIKSDVTAELINALTKEEHFTILLSHRPEYFKEYTKSRADLTFTGHAHGGQFRLPFIGGVVAPGQGLFPKYDKGVYQENDKYMICSAGIGNSIIPVRFNNQPEIVLVELKSMGDD